MHSRNLQKLLVILVYLNPKSLLLSLQDFIRSLFYKFRSNLLQIQFDPFLLKNNNTLIKVYQQISYSIRYNRVETLVYNYIRNLNLQINSYISQSAFELLIPIMIILYIKILQNSKINLIRNIPKILREIQNRIDFLIRVRIENIFLIFVNKTSSKIYPNKWKGFESYLIEFIMRILLKSLDQKLGSFKVKYLL